MHRHAALLLAALVSCDPKPDPGPTPASTATAEATASASTAGAANASPHAGSWRGRYQTKKGAVEVPAGVEYDSWTKDDGSARSGEGTIVLTVAGDGEVRGTVDGALGELRVRGLLEDGELSAGVTPADPHAEDAMTGVLTGRVEGQRLAASLRVADDDALLVRTAAFSLEKSGPEGRAAP